MRISDWSSDVCSSDLSTLSTVKLPSSTAFLAAIACPSAPIVSRSILSPFQRTSRASNPCPSASRCAVIDQYSWGLQHSISRPRRSDERRVGDEWRSTVKSRWSPYQKKKQTVKKQSKHKH